MFDKKGLKSARKYRDELSKRGEASPTDFYIREFGLHPGLSTLLLNGAFLKEVWGDFTLAEKRFIAHMYEQYYTYPTGTLILALMIHLMPLYNPSLLL